MEDRQAVCLTMRLCCSSASEDLGCRRGDFSRKHYGSVELVSPIHSALVSLCDCLLILFLLHLLIDSSPHDLPSLSASPCYYLPLFSVGMDGQQRGTDESWRTGCGPAMRFASVDHSGFSTHSDVGLCRLLTSFVLFWRCRCKAAAQCVSLWLIRKLLSHCCFRGGVCVCVCARVSPSSAELSLYILIAQRDRKSKGFACDRTSYQGHIVGLSTSAVHHVCNWLVLRRNHMLPIRATRLTRCTNAAVWGCACERKEREQNPNTVVSVSQDEVIDSLDIQSLPVTQRRVKILSVVSSHLHHLCYISC